MCHYTRTCMCILLDGASGPGVGAALKLYKCEGWEEAYIVTSQVMDVSPPRRCEKRDVLTFSTSLFRALSSS